MGKRKDKKTEEEQIKDPHEPNIRSPLFIWVYLYQELPLITLASIGGAAVGALPIMLYFVLGNLIDGLTPPKDLKDSKSALVRAAAGIITFSKFQANVNRSAMFMAIIAACSFVAAWCQFFFANWAHDNMGTRLKAAYFRSLLNQEIGYFDMKKIGELVNELTESMEGIQDTYSLKLTEFVKNIVQAILGVALAINAGWKMALVMLSTAPLLAVVLGGAGILVQVFTKLIGKINGRAAGVANEVISAMRTVRSMDGEEREKQRFNSRLRASNLVYVFKATSLGTSLGAANFSIWGVVALAFWYGGRLVIRQEMTTGQLFQVFGFVLMAVIGLSAALQVLPDFGKATASVVALLKVIQRPPALRPSGGITPNKIEGHIRFEHVNFTYPTRPNVQVLKDFNLTITPGQAVALVGASGSGKSTIVGLLERFYEPQSGKVYLDNVDLADIDPRWLHRNIGIVTQEPTLFATTIEKNIRYAIEGTGREVTQEDIHNAAIAANAHDFITALPDGYNTMLGERGVSLSGGQKQRIAIARAMIQNPSLLLLDEATSALDTQSEATVQEALNRLMQGRTTIVIAHRLSTVVDSDVICVMSKGELKEKGTHHELLKIKDGYYWKLAQKQMMFAEKSRQKMESESNNAATSTDDSITNSVDQKDDQPLLGVDNSQQITLIEAKEDSLPSSTSDENMNKDVINHENSNESNEVQEEEQKEEQKEEKDTSSSSSSSSSSSTSSNGNNQNEDAHNEEIKDDENVELIAEEDKMNL